MKNEDIDNMLNNIDLPNPENIKHQQELKIPLLSFKKSSRVGLWLLLVPVVFAFTLFIKYELNVFSSFLDVIENFFAAISRNNVLTFLIPIIFIGLPLTAMIINFLAFCHFNFVKDKKELLITVKYRPLNITIFLFSFALLVFFFMPDRFPF